MAEATASPRQVARDWIEIWQSELAGLAQDRELAENWARLSATWAQAAHALADWLPDAADAPAGRAGTGPAAGTPPAPPPPDAGLDPLRRLEARVAELERELARRQP